MRDRTIGVAFCSVPAHPAPGRLVDSGLKVDTRSDRTAGPVLRALFLGLAQARQAAGVDPAGVAAGVRAPRGLACDGLGVRARNVVLAAQAGDPRGLAEEPRCLVDLLLR